MDQRYLIDNNVLAKLTRDELRSDVFQNRSWIPDEVLHEAGEKRRAELGMLRYPTGPDVLRQLQRVMASLAPGDTALLDLYRDKGNADPLLVACALVESEMVRSMLFGPEWMIVTDDKAVRSVATNFEINTIGHSSYTLLCAGTARE